jgi:hypothetical protein
VGGLDGDVGDLEHKAAVTDDAAHSNDAALMANHDAKARVGEADRGTLGALGAEARDEAQAEIVLCGWRLVAQGVALVHLGLMVPYQALARAARRASR